MFTTAEQRAIDQLSTESGRLAVVAADQRTKLVEALQAAGLESRMDFMRAYKLDLVSALAPAAPPARTGLLVSLERSGSRRTPDGLRSAELLPGVGADGVRRLGGTGAKLLLRLRADREGADGENAAVLREAVADCAAHHLLLVVEVLVYRLDDEDEAGYEAARGYLIREAALLAESCGARYLKLEYPGDEQACLRVTDALSVPWALLSAGVDHETFMVQLRAALAAGAAGFIAGRSIWKESVTMRGEERRAFLGGKARRRLDQLLAIAG
jgi:sulfofructosephosphate aldolase